MINYLGISFYNWGLMNWRDLRVICAWWLLLLTFLNTNHHLAKLSLLSTVCTCCKNNWLKQALRSCSRWLFNSTDKAIHHKSVTEWRMKGHRHSSRIILAQVSLLAQLLAICEGRSSKPLFSHSNRDLVHTLQKPSYWAYYSKSPYLLQEFLKKEVRFFETFMRQNLKWIDFTHI